ncbi:hypothetical protein BH10ACT3_BH10ACT3_15430 [soil metagenome]
MDVTASLQADVEPDALFAVVADLGGYPRWLDIVPRSETVAADPGDPGPAWSVDLRGQLGPLRRSKRLRMVRSVSDAPHVARFERRELDDRAHSEWVLEARVEPTQGGGGSTLSMSLHYGGSMWVPMLDRLLSDEIVRSRERLLRELDATA